jgi:xylan 1,4-beta-xylosidase
MMAVGAIQPVNVVLTGLPADAAVLVETLDQTHANATAAWEAMGSPEPPTREQTEILRQGAMETQKELLHADSTGSVAMQRRLSPWAVVLVRQM